MGRTNPFLFFSWSGFHLDAFWGSYLTTTLIASIHRQTGTAAGGPASLRSCVAFDQANGD